jgi:hemolysin activation/secretion protein
MHRRAERAICSGLLAALMGAGWGITLAEEASPDLSGGPTAARALSDLTPSAATASPASAATPAIDTQALTASPRFPIRRFDFKGAAAIPEAALRQATQRLTGPDRSFADIEDAVQAVVEAYGKAGIHAVNVEIPEQTLEDGVVQLEVTEKKVQKVETQGVKARSIANLRRAAPSLLEGTVPNDDTLAQELRLANENPARQMQVTFRVEEDDESLTGVLRVADRPPLSGQFSLDNTGNAATGQWRFGTALQHANLLDRDIVGALQVQTSPGHWGDVRVVSGSLRAPWYSAGWMFEWSALSSNVDSGVVNGTDSNGRPYSFGMVGKGGQWGLKATRLLERSWGWEPRVTFGMDFRRTDNRGDSQTERREDINNYIELHPLTITASALKVDESLTLSVMGAATRNFPGSGRSASPVFAQQNRPTSTPDYTSYKLQANARWPAGKGFVILGWNGQWTRDVLVPAEQFSIGGDASVRGFNGRVAPGDKGHRLGIEWQSATSAVSYMEGLQWGWSAFADWGQVWLNTVNDIPKITLSSVGLGLRGSYRDGLSVRADAGVVTRGQGLAPKGQVFVHVGANYGF